MKIAIIYTNLNKSTRKSCEILSNKINADTKLISVKNAKTECILKYNFIIIATSAINGKVQKELKLYLSRNGKNLMEKPIGLVINCEENIDRFNKTFTEERLNHHISNQISVMNFTLMKEITSKKEKQLN